jgi:DNA-binding protein HU-beta
MNKADLIEAIANDVELSKADAGKALDSLTKRITQSLKKGENVTLVGFGTFSVTKRKARTGRNPQTGETIQIAASKGVKVSAGSKLKAAVKGG